MKAKPPDVGAVLRLIIGTARNAHSVHDGCCACVGPDVCTIADKIMVMPPSPLTVVANLCDRHEQSHSILIKIAFQDAIDRMLR